MADESETEKDLSFTEAVKTKELLSRLKASEGWHKLQEIIQARAANLQHSILGFPLDDQIGVYKQEFRKGHAVGLLEVSLLLDQVLETAEDLIKLEDEDEEDAS